MNPPPPNAIRKTARSRTSGWSSVGIHGNSALYSVGVGLGVELGAAAGAAAPAPVRAGRLVRLVAGDRVLVGVAEAELDGAALVGGPVVGADAVVGAALGLGEGSTLGNGGSLLGGADDTGDGGGSACAAAVPAARPNSNATPAAIAAR